MPLGYAIDVVAEIQGQVSHVPGIVETEHVLHRDQLIPTQNSHRHFHGQAVVACCHRRVCGKDALPSDRFDVLSVECFATCQLRVLVEQCHRQQTGVALVHVKPRDALIAERSQHPHSPDAKNHFLAKPVVAVAAVERISQCPIPVGVLREIGVE